MSDNMIGLYNELKSLFITNSALAIKKCQETITSNTNFDTYQEFYSYHLKHAHISTCQKEWTDSQMSIHCFDCSIDRQSCICLQCFLNGNHKNHDYIIYPNSTGNCDCGDLTLWKHSGCCKEHQGLNEDDHPENYLDEKLRNLLTDIIFKSVFASFPHLQGQTEQKVSPIFQFLSSFLKLGDGFRRLLAISLTEKIKFNILLPQIFAYKLFFNKLFQQLCGGLLNDQLFKVNFARANYELMLKKTIPDILTKYVTHDTDANYSMWTSFWFHSFSPQPIKACIEKFNWDWVTFLIEFSKHMKTFFNMKSKIAFNQGIANFFSEITNNMSNASLIQPNEQTQRFFDELFTMVLNSGASEDMKNNTIISASFLEMHEDFYYYSIHIFELQFYDLFECFKLKRNLKFEKLIEELDRKIDISPIFCLNHNEFAEENDKFVAKYLLKIDDISSIEIDKNSQIKVNIEDHFRSFHNGGAFFFTMPLFDSLCYLFRNDNMSRVKIAKLLKKANFKRLRIHLAIVALKKLIALFCCNQSIVSKRNFALLALLIPKVNNPRVVHKGIPLVFPLFQMLIGLQSEKVDDSDKLNEFSIKEFFAFEMARELGLFDNFKNEEYKDENIQEKEEEMTSSFLYISLLLNIERTLFNFNAYYFMEELLISALKQGKSSPVDLNKMVNMSSDLTDKCQSYFNTIISKITKVIKNKNNDSNHDIAFALKDDIEWKPISAIVPFNDQKTLINKEILKNQNSLLKIQEFDDENDFFFKPSTEIKANPEDEENIDEKIDSTGIEIKLKEFLLTPTVLSIVYHTLRKSENKIELNDHLALNILILAYRFADDFERKPFDKSTTINYNSKVSDLISQMKRTLFDFETDETGNSTIKNTINKVNFRTLLDIKISQNSKEPKSFIDILTNKGEIGKSVLRKLNVDIEIDSNSIEKKSMKEINKKRANKLKQSIIDQYKSVISSYYTNDSVDMHDETNVNDEVCSICSSTRNDQILSFPLYIYRTKIPFIVDKPPFSDAKEGVDIGVDEDRIVESRSFFDLLLPKKEEKPKIQKKDDRTFSKRVTYGNNFVIQFSICQHPIHKSCVNSAKNFKCPIDRSMKNGFLPFVAEIDPNLMSDYEKVPKPIKDSIENFLNDFKEFFENKNTDLFIELAKSISGLITTFEIRLRNLPDCLDSSKNEILARNLFLTTWYGYRILKKPEIKAESTERLTQFQRFILALIQSDEIEGANRKSHEFERIFSSFFNSNKNGFIEKDALRNDKEIFLFLRRVCLADHFLLNGEIDDSNQVKFIDWDEILSVSNLSQKFNVPFSNLNEDFEFKPIVFTKLPKEFLEFGGYPFNFPIEKTSHFTSYNILDYNDLIQNYDDFSPEKPYLGENENLIKKIDTCEKIDPAIFFKYMSKNYPSVLLLIGGDASAVVVVDRNKNIILKPFYLDKFGCPDPGFKRGRPLFLNEEKYGRVMDLVLSGDFSFYDNSNERQNPNPFY